MAGLIAGLRLAGLKTKVVGVLVADKFVTNPQTIAKQVGDVWRLLQQKSGAQIPDLKLKPDDFIFLDNYLGKGYGHPTEAAQRSIDLVRGTEGIPLDPTYTGKAMAAMLDFAKLPQYQGKHFLFMNTYNSHDLSREAESIDPRSLPKEFHQFFQ